MNIQELREYREELKQTIDFCPPGDAPLRIIDLAIVQARRASKVMDEHGAVFTLLAEIDRLAARVDVVAEMLVKVYGQRATECGGDFSLTDCD